MTPCIDLREFGERYRISRTTRRSRDPWDLFIPGRRANIQPWGGEYLAACFHHHPELAQQTLRKPWVVRERSQVGDGVEVNAVFHVRDIEKAARVSGVEERR